MSNKNYTGIPKEEQGLLKDLEFAPSTLETVDYAMFNYVNEELDLHSTTNEGWKKAPLVWASTERAYQIKHSQEYRDKEGLIILPAITVERVSVNKDLARRGAYYGNMFPFQTQNEKGGAITIARRIQQTKTSEFANAAADRRLMNRVHPKFVRKPTSKVVYQSIAIPPIVYADVNYDIVLRTEYQQQMNELMQPFITRPGTINSFLINRDGHRYEAFVQGDFTLNNNMSDMDNEERRFETTITINVLAYLVGEGNNQDKPRYTIRENAVEVRIPREHVVWDDPIEWGGDGITERQNTAVDGKYRE